MLTFRRRRAQTHPNGRSGERIRLHLWLLLLLFLIPLPAIAQTLTTVTATITDPNGFFYTGARVTVFLQGTTGTVATTPCPGNNLSPGCVVQIPSSFYTDSRAGKFTINLWANASIACAPVACPSTTYSFRIDSYSATVNPPQGTGSQSFTVSGVTISGASQDISATLSAAAPALMNVSTSGCGATTVTSGQFCGGPQPTNSGLVQSNTGGWYYASGTTWTEQLAYPGSTTAGHTLVAIEMSDTYQCALNTAVVPTDTQGNTWTYLATSEIGGSGNMQGDAAIFTTTAALTANDTVSATYGCRIHGLVILDFSSLGAFDSKAGAGNAFNTAGIWQGTITTNHADVVIGIEGMTPALADATNILVDNTWQILSPGVVPLVGDPSPGHQSGLIQTFPSSGAKTITFTSNDATSCVFGCGASVYLWSFQTTQAANSSRSVFRTILASDLPASLQISTGRTTATLGGSALTAGACSSATVNVGNASGNPPQVGQVASVNPEADPGAGFYWKGFVSAVGVVTVEVCAAVAGTPTAEFYDVRVLP